MNYNVGGISRSAPEWAKCLGISDAEMTLQLRRGTPMKDVVHMYQADTFAAGDTDRPPLRRATSSTFVSGVTGPSGKAGYAITTDCRQCAAAARDYYDDLHAKHVAQSDPKVP